jgi:hypothetical protein
MNSQEARQVLLLYRPGTADAEDPQIIEAIGCARRDPALAQWFEQHCAFQKALRSKLRQIEVPAHRKLALLVSKPMVRPPAWWHNPVWLAAAASLVLLLGLAGIWAKPRGSASFVNFQSRMVSTALRQYRMDVVTNDMSEVRRFLAAGGAPADYGLPGGLERLRLTGAGLLRWSNHPVSMVCFDRGDNQMIYLFVLNRSALSNPPPQMPQLAKVSEMMTASWTRGDRIYLLAGPEEPDFAGKYLPPSS